MEKYISKEVILTEQYFKDKEISGVLIGKNDPNDRWDDTPDGPYIQGEQYKMRVKDGDWVVKKENSRHLEVYSNDDFNKKYQPYYYFL